MAILARPLLLSRTSAFNLHRVEYDIEEMAHAMKLAGFDPYVYENLFKGTRIGGGISRVKTIAE